MLSRIAERSGRPVLYSLTQYHEQPDDYRAILALNRQAAARGGADPPGGGAARDRRAARPGRPARRRSSGCPTFRALAGLPLPVRVARLRDPAVRAAILAEDPVGDSTFPLLRLLSYDRMYRFGTPPNYTPQAHDSVAAVAARTSRPAPEVAYDLLLANAGRDFLYTPIRNYAAPGLTACEELLADRLSIMGLGDGGAHVGFIPRRRLPDLAAYLLGQAARPLAAGGADPPPDLGPRRCRGAARPRPHPGRVEGRPERRRLAAARLRAAPCRARPARRRRPPDAGRARLPLHGGEWPGDLSRRPTHRRAARQAGARHARVGPITGSMPRQANRGATPCPDWGE